MDKWTDKMSSFWDSRADESVYRAGRARIHNTLGARFNTTAPIYVREGLCKLDPIIACRQVAVPTSRTNTELRDAESTYATLTSADRLAAAYGSALDKFQPIERT